MEMRPFGKLLPLDEAVHRLLAVTVPVRGSESVRLEEAVGRVPVRGVRALSNVPPFVRATWDGYALRSSATRGARPERPRTFHLVGEVFAERALRRPLAPGETVAIATGGALPKGTDTVLIFEEARVGTEWVTVSRYVRPAERVARIGADYRRGTVLAPPDRALTPASIGALASTGLSRVEVHRRPRIAVLPNGNELVAPGRPLGPEQIYESNNLVLASLVRAVGAEARTHPPVVDDPARIESAIRRALSSSDLVLVTGGSSVGERDFLPEIFPRLGRLLFHGIAVRPGKPTLAAVARGKLVLGLPGHPTSCLANGFWMLLPVLRKLGHLAGSGTTRVPVVLETGYPIARGPLATVVPLRVDAGRARPTFKDSHAITSLIDANGFLIVPPGSPSLRRGERRVVELLPEPIAAPPRAG